MSGSTSDAYRRAGVDIDAQDQALDRVKEIARSTYTEGVLSEIGSFGGLYRLPEEVGRSVLVASADGVGTKMLVARMAGDYSTVGLDLVNHCVNDIMVQGARPLFFLDYVAAGTLDPGSMVELVEGVARGCRENQCALLGGETAEMPDVYQPGDYELAGFIVGVVEEESVWDGSGVEASDRLIGLGSNGLHTNGYTLARRVFLESLGLGVDDPVPGALSQRPIGERLLDPHLSYKPVLDRLRDHPGLHGAAHITGGGLTDNLPRVLGADLEAVIDLGAWQVPEIFQLLQKHGEVELLEMLRVFNMGVGMVLVMAPEAIEDALEAAADAGHEAFPLGAVSAGERGVVYRGGLE